MGMAGEFCCRQGIKVISRVQAIRRLQLNRDGTRTFARDNFVSPIEKSCQSVSSETSFASRWNGYHTTQFTTELEKL